jgi:hypothetical protein
LIPFVQLSVEEEEKVSFPSTDVRRWPSLHSRHASSKRHDPADKFQSSSLPTPPLLHFFDENVDDAALVNAVLCTQVGPFFQGGFSYQHIGDFLTNL